MSQVSKVINLFNNPDGKTGFLRQVVSYDDKLHQASPTEAMVQIANAMFIMADQNVLDRKDPDSRLPTVRDIPWTEFGEKFREMYKDELYLWGEDTRIAERFWHYDGEEVQAVVMRTEDGRDIAYQSSGRDTAKESELLKSEQKKFGAGEAQK